MNINSNNKNMQRDNVTEIKKMYAENSNTEGRDEIVKVEKNDVQANADITRTEDVSSLGLPKSTTSLKVATDMKKKKRKRKSPLVPWKKPPGTYI
jgi:hypothetical protein